MPRHKETNKSQLPIYESDYYSKQLLDKRTGEKLVVDLVYAEKDYVEGGWYVNIMYYRILDNGGHSHGIVPWVNINCKARFCLDLIKETHEKFSLVEP